MKAGTHYAPRQGAPVLDRIRAVLRDRARRHKIQTIEGFSYAYLAGCARCSRRHAIRVVAILIAAGEIEKRYTTRPRRGRSRNRYHLKSLNCNTLQVDGTTMAEKPARCTKNTCHPGAREPARPKKALLDRPRSARRPMSPRTRPNGDTHRYCAVPREPLEVLGRLFPAVRNVPAARRSAISLARRISPDRWPDFRAKAEQLARMAHRYRSAWAVWYRWAVAELDGTRRWHETGLDRRQLEDRAAELRLREEPTIGSRFVVDLKAQLLERMS